MNFWDIFKIKKSKQPTEFHPINLDELEGALEHGYEFLLFRGRSDEYWRVGLYMSKMDIVHEMKCDEETHNKHDQYYVIAKIIRIVQPYETYTGFEKDWR